MVESVRELTTGAMEQELNHQLRILDAMFDDPGLAALAARYPRHPAVQRRGALWALLPLTTRPLFEHVGLAAEVARMQLDRQFWMPDPIAQDFWSFLPERAAAARVRQNLQDPEQFDETLAEVRTWAQLRHAGLNARLLEEDGLPDIRVEQEGLASEQVEVKYVHAGTNDTGVLGALKKANRQIRDATNGGAGTVFIWLEHSSEVRLRGDEYKPPQLVDARLRLLADAVTGSDYKSAACVVCAWSDATFLGSPEQGITLFVEQRSVAYGHRNPRAPSGLPKEALGVGGWTAVRIGTSRE